MVNGVKMECENAGRQADVYDTDHARSGWSI